MVTGHQVCQAVREAEAVVTVENSDSSIFPEAGWNHTGPAIVTRRRNRAPSRNARVGWLTKAGADPAAELQDWHSRERLGRWFPDSFAGPSSRSGPVVSRRARRYFFPPAWRHP